MTFREILNNIVLLGAIQGFILSGLLFAAKKNRQPNRFLAWVMLIFGVACLNICLDAILGADNDPLFNLVREFVPLVVIMPVGPLIYFYVKASLEPGFTFTKRQRWHFAPVIIDLGTSITIIVFLVGVFADLVHNDPQDWGRFIDDYNVYSDIPRWLSVTAYLWLAYRYTGKTGVQHGQQAWFRQFIRIFLVFQAVWLLYLVPYVIPSLTDYMLNVFDWYPVYIPLVALIYTLGIKAYLLPPQEPATAKKTAAPPPEATVAEVMAQLEKAMQHDQLFLQPELNLAMLSQHTGIAAKTISAVLNQHLQKSFNEYINGYRVAAFKQKILEPGFERMTIMGVAFESGFNSQATFQRCFKQLTGTSPREYIQQQSIKNSETAEN